MLADMHAHYPMHVMMGGARATLKLMRKLRKSPFRDKLRALVLSAASRLFSRPWWWSGNALRVLRAAWT